VREGSSASNGLREDEIETAGAENDNDENIAVKYQVRKLVLTVARSLV